MNVYIQDMSFIQGSQTPLGCQNVSTFSTLILYEHSGTHIFSFKQLFNSLKYHKNVLSQLSIENEPQMLIYIDMVL